MNRPLTFPILLAASALVPYFANVGQVQGRPAAAGASDARLADYVATLEAKVAPMSLVGTDLFIDGVNVVVRNGTGSDSTLNGGGNLVVGYDTAVDGAGSHNVVVGVGHTYTSHGGLVTGRNNAIVAPFATVKGGRDNAASGAFSSVLGGELNVASGPFTSIIGGRQNSATESYAVVAGGEANVAEGLDSVVVGGRGNRASGQQSVVAGGQLNQALGHKSTVVGGEEGVARSAESTLVGGFRNEVLGMDPSAVQQSTVVGGSLTQMDDVLGVAVGGSGTVVQAYCGVALGGSAARIEVGEFGVAAGGLRNRVTGGRSSTICGGRDGTVTGDWATNSGGLNRWVTATHGWVAGGLFE